MDSDKIVLPIPNIAFRRTGDTTTVGSPPILERSVSCPPTKRQAPTRFQDYNLPVRPLPARARQKTRWDPTTGKRIPITFPNTSTPMDTQISDIAALNQDDYERRLSDGLSQATLG